MLKKKPVISNTDKFFCNIKIFFMFDHGL
jgi:hypothetical protein